MHGGKNRTQMKVLTDEKRENPFTVPLYLNFLAI